jgi:hypothetical protein
VTLAARLETIIRSDPELMRLLNSLRIVALPEWRIVSGCLYQTVWNVLTHRPRGTGIQDYDLIYFDAGDLSWEAEDSIIRRVDAACASPLQTRNQARVHLWFEQHFGAPYPPLRLADEALSRYPMTVQAIGARLEPDGQIDLIAPFGLDDVFDMVLRPNPHTESRATFETKAARIRGVWPEVTIWTGT